MKKLLGIIVVGLLLSGSAYSAETNIKCTFEKGKYVFHKNRGGETFNNKDKSYYEDIYIVLDKQNKKIISYPSMDGTAFKLKNWGDDTILWEINWGEEMWEKYRLNSITAKLRTYFVSKVPGSEQAVEVYYNCLLVEKKLF